MGVVRLASPRAGRACSSRAGDERAARDLLARARVHPKLTVGEPGDAHERQADRISAQVMRVPEPARGAAPRAPLGAPLLRADALPGLGGTGQPLAAADRRFLEARFGVDFRSVRIHDGPAAADTARALGARAYTIGHDVVFDAGQYAPGTTAGRRLLAHELAHVVQQGLAPTPSIQRSLRVEDPGTALPGAPAREVWEDVRDYIARLSSGFRVATSGAITPATAATCTSPTRVTEKCLCTLHSSTNDWKIKVDDLAWPHTDEANHRVTVQSTRSPVQFGAWGGGARAGTRIDQDMSRVLGHEMCGHAALLERGTHPARSLVTVGGELMGRPSHDITVTIENTVARETAPGAPERGHFADPHHGESFARITVSGYPVGSSDPASLSADMRARLGRVKDFMLAEPLLRADIVGHTDPHGTAAANRDVSRARARHVRDYLHTLGIPRSRFLVVEGHGDRECPPAPLDNPSCRKTEIFLYIFQGASLRNP